MFSKNITVHPYINKINKIYISILLICYPHYFFPTGLQRLKMNAMPENLITFYNI